VSPISRLHVGWPAVRVINVCLGSSSNEGGLAVSLVRVCFKRGATTSKVHVTPAKVHAHTCRCLSKCVPPYTLRIRRRYNTVILFLQMAFTLREEAPCSHQCYRRAGATEVVLDQMCEDRINLRGTCAHLAHRCISSFHWHSWPLSVLLS
jgi:hypothetical protein